MSFEQLASLLGLHAGESVHASTRAEFIWPRACGLVGYIDIGRCRCGALDWLDILQPRNAFTGGVDHTLGRLLAYCDG